MIFFVWVWIVFVWAITGYENNRNKQLNIWQTITEFLADWNVRVWIMNVQVLQRKWFIANVFMFSRMNWTNSSIYEYWGPKNWLLVNACQHKKIIRPKWKLRLNIYDVVELSNYQMASLILRLRHLNFSWLKLIRMLREHNWIYWKRRCHDKLMSAKHYHCNI